MSSSKIITSLRNEIALRESNTRDRIEDLQSQVEALAKRLEKYDTPPKGTKPRKKDFARLERDARPPIPVPERPAVMKAADVGEDPR